MNPPTRVSGDEPADFRSLIDDEESAGQREGLPASFRMRNAHYVDQLETPPRPLLKAIPISTIEAETLRDAPESLIASIRRHGVLEPVLVQQALRGRQYRLIAGRRRLAAARAAGLREIPCVIYTISDAEAAEWIDATRSAGERPEAATPHPTTTAVPLYPAQRELESALTTIESCTPLLTQASATARRGAVQVIDVECQRSQRLLTAMRVLTDTAAMHRALVDPADLFGHLAGAFRDEQRLLGIEPAIHVHCEPQVSFYGDSRLLTTAMAGAMAALTAAAGERPRDIALHASGNTAGMVALELADRSMVLPESFVRTAFTTPWPVHDGDLVLLMLQAARRIAIAHNGSLTIASDATRTTFTLELPADQTRRTPVN